MLDQLSKNITRCGLSNSTLNYLRVSVWEEGGDAALLPVGEPRVATSRALSCPTPGCPGARGGSGVGSARGTLPLGCREPWGSGAAGAHRLPAWLGPVQRRRPPERGAFAGAWSIAM